MGNLSNLRSNCTYVITSCVHVRNLHLGANVHAGANLLHHICTTYKGGANLHPGCKFAPGCIFRKHRLHDQNTPQVQIYTPGVYLRWGVYCAYERGFEETKASFICTIYIPVQINTQGVNLHLGCILVI